MLSEEILKARRGKFSASENHALMAGWDKVAPPRDGLLPTITPVMQKMWDNGERKFNLEPEIKALFNAHGIKPSRAAVDPYVDVIKWHNRQPPAGLITYAQEKACEELSEPDPSVWDGQGNPHIDNGNEREADCVILLERATGLKFTNTGEDQSNIHDGNGCACTPDGVIEEFDMVMTGCEVKCKSILVHLRNMLITDNASLLREDMHRYCQVQTAMMITGADHWYSADYNPHVDESLRFGFIKVKRDERFIDALRERLVIAKRIKQEFIEQLHQSNKIRAAA